MGSGSSGNTGTSTGGGGSGSGGTPSGGGGLATKRQRNGTSATEGHPKENFWHENKLYDQNLKTTKQKIEQQHGCTYLSHLLKSSSTSIPKALNNLGLNIKQCGCYMLWGSCRDQSCTLLHDDTPLSAEQVGVLAAILTDSATKLPTQKSEK